MSGRFWARLPFVVRHLLLLLVALTLALTAWVQIEEPQPVGATHFRAMQLSWRKTATRTAEFTATFGVRRSYYGNPLPNVGSTVFGPTIFFGDGTNGGNSYQVIAVDLVNDYLIAERVASRTYAADNQGGVPYTAYIDECCRLSPSGGHVNNPDDTLRITTLVNFANNTAGAGSPTSTVTPIVDCLRAVSPGSRVCEFSVPALDPDNLAGYRLRWRMATLAEMGNGVTSQPTGPYGSATIDPDTGLYRWNTTNVPLSACPGSTTGCPFTYYSTQVVIEKWHENGTAGDTTDDTRVSSVAADFFIRFNNNAVNNPPAFTSGPLDGASITVPLGQPYSLTFTAEDPDGDQVTPGLINRPPGATFTPTVGNPATGTLAWSSPISGSYQVVLTAQDPSGLGATQRTITLVVPALPPTSLVVSGTGTYGGSATLAATLTSGGAPIEGATVALALNGVPVCDNAPTYPVACPVTGADGVATLSNVATTGLVGSIPYPLAATYFGDVDHLGAAASGSLTLTPADQAITFPDPGDATYGDGPIALAATASSGLPVAYATSGPCQIANGNQVQITGAGICVVTAQQPGDGNYQPALSVEQPITIAKKALTVRPADQTVQFGAAPPCVVASGYPLGLAYNDTLASLGGALACASSPAVPLNLGGYPLHASGLTSDNYAISYIAGRLTVVACPVVLVLDMPAEHEAQYSDRLILAAHLVNCGGIIYPGGPVQFRLGSSIVGSAAMDGQGVASQPVKLMHNVGDHKLTATFSPTDSRFTGSSAGPVNLAVTREQATASYSGNTSFAVNNATRRGTVTLKATLTDITAIDVNADPSPGDIRTARVRFEKPDGGSINPACDNVTVGLVNANDTKVGMATCSFQSVAVAFQVRVVVLGNYVGQSSGTIPIIVGNGGANLVPIQTRSRGTGGTLLAARREDA
jgi:hypothetical protein